MNARTNQKAGFTELVSSVDALLKTMEDTNSLLPKSWTANKDQ